MVAEHGDDRDTHARGQIPDKNVGFLGRAVVGQVTAKKKDIRVLCGMSEQRKKSPV